MNEEWRSQEVKKPRIEEEMKKSRSTRIKKTRSQDE